MKIREKTNNKKFIKGSLQWVAVVMVLVGLSAVCINMSKLLRGYNAQSKVIWQIPSNQEALPLLTGFLEVGEIEEGPALYEKRPEVGDEIGELFIPKLDAILPIFEGTSEEELELGVGHYAGSVLPGEKDNSVLSGHRDTVFRRLGDVGVGDTLIVRTVAGEFEYKVDKVKIVDKEDRTVIVPRPRATLTLSTCYPFSYLGSAPQRYILVAYLVQ